MALSQEEVKELFLRFFSKKCSREDFRVMRTDPTVKAYIQSWERSDALPMIFSVKGDPYSLADYPQFRSMYDAEYTPEAIWMTGRQTGKSINLSRSEAYDAMQIPHFQILYVAPLQSQTHRFSSIYLKEALLESTQARHMQRRGGDSGVIRAVGHQTFTNGSGIQLTYAKTSADRARGIFCDRLDCDELQDHLVDNLSVIMQSLTQSKWNVRRYTGTAKTLDNTIEYYWRQSSMSEWCIKCDSCNKWNVPTIDGGVMDMIQPHGPCCTKCGAVLNTHSGVWVPAEKDRLNTFPGYHIPQIFVPAIAEDPSKWSSLYHKTVNSPVAHVCQEILGISSSTGARLITQDDINKASCLPSTEILHKRLRDYPVIVSGVDWGIAEQQSFTVQTVLGVRPDGKMHVLWAKRFVGFDTDNMLKDIGRTHRYYKCHLLGADYGVGFTQNTILANRFGLPVVQIQYTAQNQLMSYRPLLGYPRWCVNKVTALQMMFFAIRYGSILFPPQDEFKRYTDDLLSPYQDVRDERGTEKVYFVRNPNVPDDFANALCFAMVAAMQLTGNSLVDTLPEGAMGADVAWTARPDHDTVDPMEILRPA